MTLPNYAVIGLINGEKRILKADNEIGLQFLVNETGIRRFRRCLVDSDREALDLIIKSVTVQMRNLEQSDDMCYTNGMMDRLRRERAMYENIRLELSKRSCAE